MNMQQGQQTEAATVILYLSAAICSGSGSRRKLDLVQARSLFTFMSRVTDGPASFFPLFVCVRVRVLQQSLVRRASMSQGSLLVREFWQARVLANLWRRRHACLCVGTHMHTQISIPMKLWRKLYAFLPVKHAKWCKTPPKNINAWAEGAGLNHSLKVTSQSAGVLHSFPPPSPSIPPPLNPPLQKKLQQKSRRWKLARQRARRECYLLVIVVVILCPVWQHINEQHANTFCPNICDRHIFRPPSRKWKKEKKGEGKRGWWWWWWGRGSGRGKGGRGVEAEDIKSLWLPGSTQPLSFCPCFFIHALLCQFSAELTLTFFF